MMQVTNHSNNIRKMKEEMLEAIYGTVERLEQKVDELSASPKNAGAETVLSHASVDTSKLEKPSFLCCTKIPWKRNSFHGIFLKLFYRISIISYLFFL